MTGLDDALVEFVVDTPAAAVPARARVNAVDTIVDTVATTWAGITEPGAVVIRDATLAVGGGRSRAGGRARPAPSTPRRRRCATRRPRTPWTTTRSTSR